MRLSNDFIGAGGVDELRGANAGGFERGGGAIAQFMDAAMHVGVVAFVVVNEGFDDGTRLLAGGGVVEVNERVSVHRLAQRGKVLSNLWPVDRHGLELKHPKLEFGRL